MKHQRSCSILRSKILELSCDFLRIGPFFSLNWHGRILDFRVCCSSWFIWLFPVSLKSWLNLIPYEEIILGLPAITLLEFELFISSFNCEFPNLWDELEGGFLFILNDCYDMIRGCIFVHLDLMLRALLLEVFQRSIEELQRLRRHLLPAELAIGVSLKIF